MRGSMINYQRGPAASQGRVIDPKIPARLITRTHGDLIAAAAGLPGVRQLMTPGVGAHRDGLAIDYQAGIGNDLAHEALASVVREHWDYLGVRYMAWGGQEWGGSWGGVERVRPQTVNYGGTDPWHRNHVHVDFRPTAQIRTSLPARPASPAVPRPTPQEDTMSASDIWRGITLNARHPKESYGLPEQTPASRLTAAAERSGRALIVAREIRAAMRGIFNRIWRSGTLNARHEGTDYGLPEQTPAGRLTTAAEHSRRAVVLGRRIESEVQGLTAAVKALAEAQGIDPERIETIVREATEAALEDVSITLTVTPKED